MAAIVRNSGANIIKNTGDSLIYYFPRTSDPTHISAFKGVIECGSSQSNHQCKVTRRSITTTLL